MLGVGQLGSVFWSIVCAAGLVLLPCFLWRSRRALGGACRVVGRRMLLWGRLFVLPLVRNQWVRFAFALLIVPVLATGLAGIVLFGDPSALAVGVAAFVYVPAGAAFLVLWRRSRWLALTAYLILALLPVVWSWGEADRAEQAVYDERLYVPELGETGYHFSGGLISAQCRLIKSSRLFSRSLLAAVFCLAGLRWAVAGVRWQRKLAVSLAGLAVAPLVYLYMPGPVCGPWRDGFLGCMTHVCAGAEYWGDVTSGYNICGGNGEGSAGAGSGVPYRRTGLWRILWGVDEDADGGALAFAIPARVGLFALWAQEPRFEYRVVAWRYLDVLTLRRTYRYIEFLETKQEPLHQMQNEWKAAQPPAPETPEGSGLMGGPWEFGEPEETPPQPAGSNPPL